MTPKEPFEGRAKQTKEGRQASKHTESGDFTAYYFKIH